jgi:hypothetical protein
MEYDGVMFHPKGVSEQDTKPRRLSETKETWLSGRKYLTANEASCKRLRGFESLRLRFDVRRTKLPLRDNTAHSLRTFLKSDPFPWGIQIHDEIRTPYLSIASIHAIVAESETGAIISAVIAVRPLRHHP